MDANTPTDDTAKEDTVNSSNPSPPSTSAPVSGLFSFPLKLPFPFIPSQFDQRPEEIDERFKYHFANGADSEYNSTVESRYGTLPEDRTGFLIQEDNYHYGQFNDYSYPDEMSDAYYHTATPHYASPHPLVSSPYTPTQVSSTPPPLTSLKEKELKILEMREKIRQLEEEKQRREQAVAATAAGLTEETDIDLLDKEKEVLKTKKDILELDVIEQVEATTVKQEKQPQQPQSIQPAQKQQHRPVEVIVIDSDSDGEAMDEDVLPLEQPAASKDSAPATPAYTPQTASEQTTSNTPTQLTDYYAVLPLTYQELDDVIMATNEDITKSALDIDTLTYQKLEEVVMATNEDITKSASDIDGDMQICSSSSVDHGHNNDEYIEIDVEAVMEAVNSEITNHALHPTLIAAPTASTNANMTVKVKKEQVDNALVRDIIIDVVGENSEKEELAADDESSSNVNKYVWVTNDTEDETTEEEDEDSEEEEADYEEQLKMVAGLNKSLDELNAYIQSMQEELSALAEEEKQRKTEILALSVRLSILKNMDVLEAGELKQSRYQQQQPSTIKRSPSRVKDTDGIAKRKRGGEGGDLAAPGNSSGIHASDRNNQTKRQHASNMTVRRSYQPPATDSNDYYNNVYSQPQYPNHYQPYSNSVEPYTEMRRLPYEGSHHPTLNSISFTPNATSSGSASDRTIHYPPQRRKNPVKQATTTAASASTSTASPSNTATSANTISLSERLKSLIAVPATSTAMQPSPTVSKEEIRTAVSNTLLQVEHEIRQALTEYNIDSNSEQPKTLPSFYQVIRLERYVATVRSIIGVRPDEGSTHYSDTFNTSTTSSIIELSPSLGALFGNFKQPFIHFSPLLCMLKRIYIRETQGPNKTKPCTETLDTLYRTLSNYIPSDFDWTALFMSRYLLNVPLQYQQLNAMYQLIVAWTADYPDIEMLAALKLELAIYADPVKLQKKDFNGNHDTVVLQDFRAGMEAFPFSVDVFWQWLIYRRSDKARMMHEVKTYLTTMAEKKPEDKAFVSRSTVELLTRLVCVGYCTEVIQLLTNGKCIGVNTTRVELLPLETTDIYIQDDDKYHLWTNIAYYHIMKDMPHWICASWMDSLISRGTSNSIKPLVILDYNTTFSQESTAPDKASLTACINIYFSILSYYGRSIIRGSSDDLRCLFNCALQSLSLLLAAAKLAKKKDEADEKKILLSLQKSIQSMNQSLKAAEMMELDFDLKLRYLLLAGMPISDINAAIVRAITGDIQTMKTKDKAFAFAHQIGNLYAQRYDIYFDNNNDTRLLSSLFQTNQLLVLVYILYLPISKITSELSLNSNDDDESNRVLLLTRDYLTDGRAAAECTTTMTPAQLQEKKKRLLLTVQTACHAYKRYLGIFSTDAPLSEQHKQYVFMWINLFILKKVCHMLLLDMNGSSGMFGSSRESSGEQSLKEVLTLYGEARRSIKARVSPTVAAAIETPDNTASSATTSTTAQPQLDELTILTRYVQRLFNLSVQ